MIVEQPALDYLTLSKDLTGQFHSALSSFVHKISKPTEKSRRLGYEGETRTFTFLGDPSREGSFFWGHRVWEGRLWYLLISSGRDAHELMRHAFRTDVLSFAIVRCTRLDVQVTMPWPAHPFFLRHLERVEGVQASVVHGLDEVTAWSETLYLGSRASPVLVRAYRKRVSESGTDWLRVEVEYKRKASERLFYQILGSHDVGNPFLPVLERCPYLYQMIEPYLNGEPTRPKTVSERGNTIRWMETAVANSVVRLLEDHDHGRRMAELVYEWHRYALACQNRGTGV
jgi:Replication initiation factor.